MSILNEIEPVRTQEVLSSGRQPRQFSPQKAWLGRHSGLVLDITLLLWFAVLVRLPYFIRTVIDWDESTFIIMADSLLNGHLPQTEFSAFKPPLAYVPYALFLLVFGQSIAAVRLGGLICVFVASVAIYLVCRQRFGTIGALIAGMCVSAFATVDHRCGCTMLEHIALAPLSIAVLIWPRGSLTVGRSFWIGTLIGLAAAMKTNLAGFILAPLCLLFMQLSLLGWKRTLWLSAVLMLGLSLPLAAPVPVYWLSGNLDLWWHSCMLAGSSYVLHNAQTVESHIPSLIRQVTRANPAGLALSWLSPMLALLIASKYKHKFQQERTFLIAMAIFVVSGLLTVLATGKFHVRHHFLVLIPFTAAMSGFMFQLALSSRRRVLFALTTLCLLSLSLSPVFVEYASVWQTVVEKRSTDTAYKVAEYLNSRDVYGKYVYFTKWNIGYWMTGALIPTRFIHPSHMGESHMLSSLYRKLTDPVSELRSIFQKRPVYVVTDIADEQIRGDDMLKRAFENELRSNYVLETIIDGAGIFRRTGQ